MQNIMGHLAMFGDGYANAFIAAVPEPASGGLLILTSSLLLTRRRRSAVGVA